MKLKPSMRLCLVPRALALAVGLCGLMAATAAAQEPVNADIAIVSTTANVRHAKVGQLVTFTIVATNNGPEASQLDVFEQPLVGLHMVEETCDRGISADTPSCEYSQVQPGETVTTTVVAEVDGGVGRYAMNTACLSNESGLPDPDPSNDCATTTVRIIGSGASAG